MREARVIDAKEVTPPTDLLAALREDQLIHSPSAQLTPLTGGVSSEIYLVRDGDRPSFVVKRALSRLKVQQEWNADPRRNVAERDYLQYVAGFLPDAVPKLLKTNPARDYFAMEYLGPEFVNWKSELLAGRANISHAILAGQTLGTIHRVAAGDPRVAEKFNTLENFRQLRIEPYLHATAARNPDLRTQIEEQADALAHSRETLVHGDFSPKNILIHGERLVLLDCEVAWYGGPAFDVAFLLNHFCLKSLYHAPRETAMAEMAAHFIAEYVDARQNAIAAHSTLRATALLLPMLMLARVDGKSPVEYLDESRRKNLREFAREEISRASDDLSDVLDRFFQTKFV